MYVDEEQKENLDKQKHWSLTEPKKGILCDDLYPFYEQCSYVTIVCIILFSSRLTFFVYHFSL